MKNLDMRLGWETRKNSTKGICAVVLVLSPSRDVGLSVCVYLIISSTEATLLFFGSPSIHFTGGIGFLKGLNEPIIDA